MGSRFGARPGRQKKPWSGVQSETDFLGGRHPKSPNSAQSRGAAASCLAEKCRRPIRGARVWSKNADPGCAVGRGSDFLVEYGGLEPGVQPMRTPPSPRMRKALRGLALMTGVGLWARPMRRRVWRLTIVASGVRSSFGRSVRMRPTFWLRWVSVTGPATVWPSLRTR